MSDAERETQELINEFHRKEDGWFDFCSKLRAILTNFNKRIGFMEAGKPDPTQIGAEPEREPAVTLFLSHSTAGRSYVYDDVHGNLLTVKADDVPFPVPWRLFVEFDPEPLGTQPTPQSGTDLDGEALLPGVHRFDAQAGNAPEPSESTSPAEGGWVPTNTQIARLDHYLAPVEYNQTLRRILADLNGRVHKIEIGKQQSRQR